MSLRSIPQIAKELGYEDLTKLTRREAETLLLAAMHRDLPLAVALLHKKAHAVKEGGSGEWIEDPNSPIGKQLIRLHASDALRPLAARSICHGLELSFVNCCKGVVGPRPKTVEDLLLLQIATQAGPIAYADC